MDEANTLRLLCISICRDGNEKVSLCVDEISEAHIEQATIVKNLAPYGGGVSFSFAARAGAAPRLISVVEVCLRAQLAILTRHGKESLRSFFGDAFVEGEDPGEAEIRLTYELAAPAASAAESGYTGTPVSESAVGSLCANASVLMAPN